MQNRSVFITRNMDTIQMVENVNFDSLVKTVREDICFSRI